MRIIVILIALFISVAAYAGFGVNKFGLENFGVDGYGVGRFGEGEAAPSGQDALLLETGDYLLLESGDKLLLE